jgi:very-short-patch-repair endonuclease
MLSTSASGTPSTVGNKWLIFAKVRQKHADFVLCSCDKISPVLVIELDDKSHDGEQQRRRDEDKNRVLEAAGIPLLRYRAKAAYSSKEIAQAIRETLSTATR